MFGVCLASFLFIITSSLLKMPISGTHTVVGALLGAGLYQSDVQNLNFVMLGKIVGSWLMSPIISTLISFTLMLTVTNLSLSQTKYRTRLLNLQLIFGFTISLFVLSLLLLLNLKQSKHSLFTFLVPSSFLIGLVTCRLFLLKHLTHKKNMAHNQLIWCVIDCLVLWHRTKWFEMLTICETDTINEEDLFN